MSLLQRPASCMWSCRRGKPRGLPGSQCHGSRSSFRCSRVAARGARHRPDRCAVGEGRARAADADANRRPGAPEYLSHNCGPVEIGAGVALHAVADLQELPGVEIGARLRR